MTVTTARRAEAPAITAEELQRRRRAYERGTHSLRLEGLTATPEAEAIAQAWLRGEISDEEMGTRTRALHGA